MARFRESLAVRQMSTVMMVGRVLWWWSDPDVA
jgi:hypothetical protein